MNYPHPSLFGLMLLLSAHADSKASLAHATVICACPTQWCPKLKPMHCMQRLYVVWRDLSVYRENASGVIKLQLSYTSDVCKYVSWKLLSATTWKFTRAMTTELKTHDVLSPLFPQEGWDWSGRKVLMIGVAILISLQSLSGRIHQWMVYLYTVVNPYHNVKSYTMQRNNLDLRYLHSRCWIGTSLQGNTVTP